MTQQKRITVYEGSQYDSDDFPDCASLNFVIAWFQKKLSLIPEEYQAVATCEIGSESNYGSSCVTIKIWYSRMETDEEEAERKREQEIRRANEEQRLLYQLEQLRARK